MDTVKEWALMVAVCGILGEVCSILMPEGESRKTGMLVLGLVMVFSLILPAGELLQELQEMDFSYETERSQIAENLAGYTEDQMMEVTKEFKQRLTTYMCDLVTGVEGIGDCQVDFIIEEDYSKETYGTVKRIYVTAYPGGETPEATESNSHLDSGFSQMAPVERIEITLDGITIVPADGKNEQTPAAVIDPRAEEIVTLLKEAFQLEEDCIFVEVKDE